MTRIIIIIIARCRSNPWLALNFFFIIFFFFFFFLIISRSVYFLTRISFPFIDSSAWYARMPVCHVLQRVNVFFSTFDQSRCISAARIFLLSLSFSCSPTHSFLSFSRSSTVSASGEVISPPPPPPLISPPIFFSSSFQQYRSS